MISAISVSSACMEELRIPHRLSLSKKLIKLLIGRESRGASLSLPNLRVITFKLDCSCLLTGFNIFQGAHWIDLPFKFIFYFFTCFFLTSLVFSK
jgi:hypothetical protein